MLKIEASCINKRIRWVGNATQIFQAESSSRLKRACCCWESLLHVARNYRNFSSRISLLSLSFATTWGNLRRRKKLILFVGGNWDRAIFWAGEETQNIYIRSESSQMGEDVREAQPVGQVWWSSQKNSYIIFFAGSTNSTVLPACVMQKKMWTITNVIDTSTVVMIHDY